MNIKIPYYEDQSRLNNSSIGWFLFGGAPYYYQKLNKLIVEDSSSMKVGRMIHKYILQPDEFWNDYCICGIESPKSANQKDFCTYMIDNTHLERTERAVEAFKLYYSTDRLSDEKVSENALKLLETLSPYIDFIINKGNKEIITWSEFNRCKVIKENIQLHKKANELLTNNEDWTCNNEFHINWTYQTSYTNNGETLPLVTVDCKSLLDRVVFNKDYSEVMLIDLKTTGNANQFKESFDKYDYGRQMAFYWKAIEYYLLTEVGLNTDTVKNIKKTTYIIAIGSNNEIKVYDIDKDLINNRCETISNIIEEITWHTLQDKWEYSRDYYTGDGTDKLK